MGTCSGLKCCQKTKGLDVNGYPACKCSECVVNEPIDNCKYNSALLKC